MEKFERLRSKYTSRLSSAVFLGTDAALSLLPLKKKTHILVACMPKSGSTYLTNILGKYDNFRRARVISVFGSREHELCPIRLSRHNRDNYVAQPHVRNSEWTQAMIEKYNLTPIVTIRNLFDVTISFRDHLRKESLDWPMASFTDYHKNMSDADLEEAIVKLVMPWYMNFYAGWRRDPDAYFVVYENLISNTEEIVSNILKHSGISPVPEKVKSAITATKGVDNRFNVGATGRGKKISPKAAEGIYELMSLYPEFENDQFFKDMQL